MIKSTPEQIEYQRALITAYVYDGLTGLDIVDALREQDGIRVSSATVYKRIKSLDWDARAAARRNREASRRRPQKRKPGGIEPSADRLALLSRPL